VGEVREMKCVFSHGLHEFARIFLRTSVKIRENPQQGN
jgi:hypothetical protein